MSKERRKGEEEEEVEFFCLVLLRLACLLARSLASPLRPPAGLFFHRHHQALPNISLSSSPSSNAPAPLQLPLQLPLLPQEGLDPL